MSVALKTLLILISIDIIYMFFLLIKSTFYNKDSEYSLYEFLFNDDDNFIRPFPFFLIGLHLFYILFYVALCLM